MEIKKQTDKGIIKEKECKLCKKYDTEGIVEELVRLDAMEEIKKIKDSKPTRQIKYSGTKST
ncbi:hypothetical protein A3F66_04330 [candidate division TM6 bacterium RIFCSPHIGHO2_12_FULL_32_22]|nr:MAG: hypothetical protein A3F66_04330 [candidate division TM6 bacterium RIFCSPHIGHO2_12_FULL_32_22]